MVLFFFDKKKNYSVGLCIPRLPSDCPKKDSILREFGKLGSNHTVKFSRGAWHHVKIREKKGPSQGMFKNANLIPWAPKLRTQDETLKQERCARREAWDLAKDAFTIPPAIVTHFKKHVLAFNYLLE